MTDNRAIEKIVNMLLAGEPGKALDYLEQNGRLCSPLYSLHLKFMLTTCCAGIGTSVYTLQEGTAAPSGVDTFTLYGFIQANLASFGRMGPGKTFYNCAVFLKREKRYSEALLYCKIARYLLPGDFSRLFQLSGELELLSGTIEAGLASLHKASALAATKS